MHPGGGAPLTVPTVPPGFRFHPTEEELLYYYLRKKVSYEAIDLDIIREIDLNKLEPWDLKDRCRIGTAPQNEWYFFSHKDKKYPTGTRTNRATTAGFWKATGRDKVVFLGSTRRIGMRKTLVFYTGRAPHGKKTDWIMHEYRLDNESVQVQEEEWVVCRVFKKKNHQRGFDALETAAAAEDDELRPFPAPAGPALTDRKQGVHQLIHSGFSFDPSMDLPQLTSAEPLPATVPSFMPGPPAAAVNATPLDVECSQNLMKLTSAGGSDRFGAADWSILDKLLASHQSLDQLFQGKASPQVVVPHQPQLMDMGASVHMRLPPLQYLGCEPDLIKLSK